MSYRVTLELSDEVFRLLEERAKEANITVEEAAIACLAQQPPGPAPGSLLRKWIGAFSSDLTDVASRHHEYLGDALYEELQGNRNESKDES